MCQLQFIDEIGQKNTWLNEKLQYSIRKLRWYKKKSSLGLQAVKNASGISQANQDQIQPGDLVRARSEAEINQTLNRVRKTKGCTFQKGMYNHCGKEYKVFKKYYRKSKTTDVSGICFELREIKTEAELKKIKKACIISDNILRKCFAKFKSFKTESEAAAFLEYETKKLGCELAFKILCGQGDSP